MGETSTYNNKTTNGYQSSVDVTKGNYIPTTSSKKLSDTKTSLHHA